MSRPAFSPGALGNLWVGGGWAGGRAASQGSTSQPTPQEERGAIARAQHFLESAVALALDPYISALIAYTLTLLRSPASPVALRTLRSLAIMQGRYPLPATPAATVWDQPTLSPRK